MEGETNSNSKNCPANTSTDQELPPANEDIMQTAHVRVFKPGVAGPQYEAMLLNQLTEIKQGQDTRRMLTQMLEDKKQQKGAKGKNTTNNHGGPAGDEEEEADKMMEQLMDATRDYREGGGSMLVRDFIGAPDIYEYLAKEVAETKIEESRRCCRSLEAFNVTELEGFGSEQGNFRQIRR